MSIGRGLGFSFGCALLGAAAWTALSLATDMRLGLVAIAVGGLAGFGMAMGARARGGLAAGLCAAGVALVCIFLSRGVVANVNASRFVAENTLHAEEFAIQQIADEVHDKYVRSDIPMTPTDEAYAPEVMTAAQRQWNALPTEEQHLRLSAAETQLEQSSAYATSALTIVTFIVDFGLFGFVFVGLAMMAAYKTASIRAVETENGWQVADDIAPMQQPDSQLASMPRGFITHTAADDEDPLERLKRMRAKAAEQSAAPEAEPHRKAA